MEIVATGAEQHIEDTASGPSHCGVVSAFLQLHFLHGFDGRNNHGAIL